MQLRELTEENIKVGIKVRSIVNPDIIGYVEELSSIRGELAIWIKWPHRNSKDCLVAWEDCRNEIVEE